MSSSSVHGKGWRRRWPRYGFAQTPHSDSSTSSKKPSTAATPPAENHNLPPATSSPTPVEKQAEALLPSIVEEVAEAIAPTPFDFLIDIDGNATDNEPDVRAYLRLLGIHLGSRHGTDADEVEGGKEWLRIQRGRKRGIFITPNAELLENNKGTSFSMPWRDRVGYNRKSDDYGDLPLPLRENDGRCQFPDGCTVGLLVTNIRAPLPPLSNIVPEPGSKMWDDMIDMVYNAGFHAAIIISRGNDIPIASAKKPSWSLLALAGYLNDDPPLDLGPCEEHVPPSDWYRMEGGPVEEESEDDEAQYNDDPYYWGKVFGVELPPREE